MLERRRTDSGLVFLTSPLLDRAEVPHAFSTRAGGVSPPPFESLNLGLLGDAQRHDDIANIHENYRRLRSAIGCEHRERCWVHQVHGSNVCSIRPDDPFQSGIKADALICDDPTRLISVKYADCVPILLASADGRAVGAVHAGWRGIVAGVIPAAVQRLAEVSGSPSATFLAAIGPCIGFNAFEVGPEVLSAFCEWFGPDAPVRPAGEKGFVDLREAIRLQLLRGGLAPENIDSTDGCTFRDQDDFFSHRRDQGITGRMAAIIGVK